MGSTRLQSLTSPYRPDVDGLRAVAVAVVILYHAEVPGFGGGFVGVDVFFVISGYLITRLLLSREQLPWRARLHEFYLRRARRILPALCFVSAAVTVVACWLLLPRDLVRFAEYLGATPVFLTNLVARMNGSYFASGQMPAALNHYWSIAVEEQFYLLYPALLWGVACHVPRHRAGVLLFLAATSLALSVWCAAYKPVAGFYLAPMRAWELLLGALLASNSAILRWTSRPLTANLLAIAGLAAIVWSSMAFDVKLPYPGLAALVPCLGTAMVIAAGDAQRTFATRVLSWRGLVFTGLISYSLYLWHWPVLAFTRYFTISAPGAMIVSGLLALIYVLAALTWRLVEQPVRTRAIWASGRSFIRVAVLANLILLAVAIILWKAHGFPQRFSPEVQALSTRLVPMHAQGQRCLSVGPRKIREGQLCRFGPSDPGLPRAMVWGDSHAYALLPAFEQLAWTHRVQLYFAANSGCAPVPGGAFGTRRNRVGREHCADFNAATLESIDRLEPQLVILSPYWNAIEKDPEAPLRLRLERTLGRISAPGRSVCVVLDVPMMRSNVPHAMAMERRRDIKDDRIGVSRSAALEEYRSVEGDIRELESRGRLRAVDPKNVLCASGACMFEREGQPLYRDSNHLSVLGAELVVPAIEPCFAGVSRR